MLKVSFNNKEVKRFSSNKVTLVTLSGKINLSEDMYCFPDHILVWLRKYIKNIGITEEGYNRSGFLIKVTGKAVCSEGDVVDPIFGERLAEARAKKILYRFMVNLSKQLFRYYFKILYGFTGIDNYKENNMDCLEGTIDKYEGLWKRENIHAINLVNDQFNRQSTTKS